MIYKDVIGKKFLIIFFLIYKYVVLRKIRL